jgi:hypothetical protein
MRGLPLVCCTAKAMPRDCPRTRRKTETLVLASSVDLDPEIAPQGLDASDHRQIADLGPGAEHQEALRELRARIARVKALLLTG